MLCLTLLVAAAYSLLSLTLLPDSLTWVEKPKGLPNPGKEKEKKRRRNQGENVLKKEAFVVEFKCAWIAFLLTRMTCMIVQKGEMEKVLHT